MSTNSKQMQSAAEINKEMLAALKVAEIGLEQLCEGQDHANECWNILRAVRKAIANAEA